MWRQTDVIYCNFHREKKLGCCCTFSHRDDMLFCTLWSKIRKKCADFFNPPLRLKTNIFLKFLQTDRKLIISIIPNIYTPFWSTKFPWIKDGCTVYNTPIWNSILSPLSDPKIISIVQKSIWGSQNWQDYISNGCARCTYIHYSSEFCGSKGCKASVLEISLPGSDIWEFELDIPLLKSMFSTFFSYLYTEMKWRHWHFLNWFFAQNWW